MAQPQNQTTQSRLSWRIANASSTEADIDIFDAIGGGIWGDGTTGQDFVKELRGIKASRINLHINSPGGMVSDALAMYAAIKAHSAQIVAYVESEASSAASFVAMAADKVAIFPNAKMHIHDGQVPFLIGANAQDMRKIAQMLDEESDNIAAIYAEKAGGTPEEWRQAMQADDGVGTMYRGKDAVKAGLADEVVKTARNYDPARIAAYVDPEPKPDPTPDPPPSTLPPDLGVQFRESASYTPAPTLEELFTKQAQQERISIGVTGGT